jgi:competence protein ComEC
MGVSIILATLSFCVGVAIALLSLHSSTVAIFLLVLVVIEGIFAIYIFKHNKEKENQINLGKITALMCLFCVLGIVRGQMYTEKVLPEELVGKQEKLRVEVVRERDERESVRHVEVKLIDNSWKSANIHLLLTLPTYPRYSVGERLSLSGELQEGGLILPKLPNTRTSFDYKQYLSIKGVQGMMIYPKVELLGEKSSSLLIYLSQIKTFAESKVQTQVASPESNLALGVLLGIDSLPQQEKDEIKSAGLSHIVVLSGFNVAILITAVLYVLRRAPLILRISISSLTVFAFMCMVGAESSLIRATIMAYVGLLATLLGKDYQARKALFFSMFVYVAYDPWVLLYDVSLHLSFLATLAIISTPLLESTFLETKKEKLWKEVKTLFVGTGIVILFTTPYLLYIFGSVSIFSIIANMLAVPVVPLFMLAALLTALLSFIPIFSSIVAYITWILGKYILFIAHIVATIPFAQLHFTIGIGTMLLLYAIMFLVYLWYQSKSGFTQHFNVKLLNQNEGIVSF